MPIKRKNFHFQTPWTFAMARPWRFWNSGCWRWLRTRCQTVSPWVSGVDLVGRWLLRLQHCWIWHLQAPQRTCHWTNRQRRLLDPDCQGTSAYVWNKRCLSIDCELSQNNIVLLIIIYFNSHSTATTTQLPRAMEAKESSSPTRPSPTQKRLRRQHSLARQETVSLSTPWLERLNSGRAAYLFEVEIF